MLMCFINRPVCLEANRSVYILINIVVCSFVCDFVVVETGASAQRKHPTPPIFNTLNHSVFNAFN